MVFTNRFLILFAISAAFMVVSAWIPLFAVVGLIWNLILLSALIPDYLNCPSPDSAFSAERITEDALSVATDNAVTLRLRNQTDRQQTLIVRDEPPPVFALNEETPRQWTVRLSPFQRIDLRYVLRPRSRGDFSFGDVHIRLLSPWKLIYRQGRLPATQRVSVYPNLHAVGEYELLLRKSHLTRQGVRRVRITGGGREFSALREYTPDDEFRTIDWKATARRGKVISRTFEAERSQDILLLIDLGRLMRQEIAQTQKLDHVVNAALMLSHVVASAEDRIGLLTFADEPKAWVPPRRGRAAAQEIIQALYAAQAMPVESDYRQAFRFLSARWRKRSLAVLFTDLADPESSAMLLTEITQLASMHPVVCVTVADPLMSQRAKQRPGAVSQVYEKAVASEVLADRERALQLLRKRGVLVVDAEPESLSGDLVARYLEVKARSLI
ncbi:MAG: DUF58 domain-containing protein [Capsulimonadales bacterium]|nr:DUF58 domain-containing protein [Capsulimonadales bacterium]